ncbi:MAG: putative sulfate exporter family transporter, partial [Planctomycetaceae bacterium]|nr:putative sulfate exporter family transporter [Planctomycetaceae bacterium]
LTDELSKPLKRWGAKLKSWSSNPAESLTGIDAKTNAAYDVWPSIGMVFLTLLVVFGFAAWVMGERYMFFAPAFGVLFLLAIAAQVLATQSVIKNYGLEYPLWGLLIGLCVTHTIGTPKFLLPAVRTEFYIKTGLVLLGAEVLLNQLLELGLPGIFISWVVTPIVLIGTYMFGQYVLKIESKTLNMVVAADMSVCGVSAAIATAAACRAKKEELS